MEMPDTLRMYHFGKKVVDALILCEAASLSKSILF